MTVDSAPRLQTAVRLILGAASLVLLAWLLAQQPVLHPDSHSYLTPNISRGPVYPLFLEALRLLFPEAPLQAAVACQTLIAFGSTLVLAATLRRYLGVPALAAQLCQILLALPLLKFAPSILSESLAYALFLGFAAAWLRHARSALPGPALAAILLACLAVLNRPPFLYLYAFLTLFFLRRALLPDARKMALILAVLTLAAAGGTVLTRSAYNFWRFGVFEQHSAVGHNLLATQLYIAHPADRLALATEEERHFFDLALAEVDRLGLSQRQWDQRRDHYDTSMTTIYFDVLGAAYQRAFGTEAADPVRQDAFYRNLGAQLAARNLKGHVLLMCRKLYDGQLFFLAQTFLLGGLCALALLRGLVPAVFETGLWTCVLTLLNYATILPGALLAMRFTFYTDVLQLVMTLALGSLAVWGTSGPAQR